MSNKLLVFGPSIFLVSMAFAVVSAVLNAPAMLLYFILVKLVYAFIVSMVIEGWRKKDKALVETSETVWNLNIKGIPVTDVSKDLINIHFRSERELRSAFTKLVLPKAIITAGLTLLACANLIESIELIEQSKMYSVSYVVAIFMFVKLFKLLHLVFRLSSAKWYVHSTALGTQTFYSAYMEKKDRMEPYLVKVFD